MYNITNSTDPANIMINLASQLPILFPMLLFFEFFVIMVGGAFANQRRIGYTNISMWGSIAGLITSTTAFILLMVDGLISLTTVSVTVAITIGFVLWFFFTGDEV